jgi:aminoglycoside phosphotransferase family enzyme/predicted kinase
MHRAYTPVTPPNLGIIEALTTPAAFDYSVHSIELIETHISWVILAGDYAYKIKKPITLDFLDFGTLDRRKFYCEEEVRLNRPWAPDIYLDVVPITNEKGQPRFGGEGTPIEFAVRMRRFQQETRLDQQLERGSLSVTDMKDLGDRIAERHMEAQVVVSNQRERFVTLTKEFIRDNFAALEGFIDHAESDHLRQWTERELKNVDSLIGQRFDDGYVRDCHGDLHLANLIRLPGGIATFDCIEFSTDLRQIDVVCDISFLVMDLVARGRHDLAAHFLNRYLERTGDYGGMSVFSLYFVYRCLVRAKVAVIRSQEEQVGGEQATELQDALRYCDMARRQIAQRVPILILMTGLSGSGKTWVSTQLMAAMPAIRLRSDIERKRVFGLGETEDSVSDIGKGIYTPQSDRKVYEALFEAAEAVLRAGHSVILDAAFLSQVDRASAVAIARNCASVPLILEISAPIELIRKRILSRSRRAEDASEAGLDVLEHQLDTAEPFTPAEQSLVLGVDNSGDLDVGALAAKIKEEAKKRGVAC